MKTSILLSGLLLIGFFISGFQSNTGTSEQENKQQVVDSMAFPDNVTVILKNSCFACHGEGGRAMALSHLKMSEWNAYSAEKKVQKSAEMCKKVSAGKMPPKGYLKDNPGAAPTKEQIDILCAWSASLK